MSLLSSFTVEKQKVDDAINVVCDRLEHSTLLQDRRAAVLSLKGFAREYKETVTAKGLRGLLKSLSIDREDEETLDATLECLLALFTVDGSGRPDDTALWIADEFTLRPEHTHNLLEIVGDAHFYIKLRAIQILASILECRARQLQECVMNSSTGTSTLVGVLDEPREQLRNEGLLLLLKLVRNHTEIQKRVAFENAFDKVLSIINEEGGLEGGIITADCLSLLSNLLASNVSNQNWFRETDSFKSLTELLQGIKKDIPLHATTAKNISSLLEISRLFVVADASNRVVNQKAFLKSSFITQVIGFSYSTDVPASIRAVALYTAADLIYCNAETQDYFVKASEVVTGPSVQAQNPNDVSALFDIILTGGEDSFDMRCAANICVQAFVSDNKDRRQGLLETMVNDYKLRKEGNLLGRLIDSDLSDDQYESWFACCTVLRSTEGDEDARDLLTALSIGDASIGEEEVSFIQTISACLVTSLQTGKMRSSIGYSMLLSSWFFDAQENVADFLEEGSTLQAIITALISPENDPVLKGVLACLLSICYAFDFSEASSVDRGALQLIILRVGRDQVHDALVNLSLSDEIWPKYGSATTRKPMLDSVFVNLYKDNFGLIRKSIDQPARPMRSRKELEAQEAYARSEDIIAELEEELERKSSGLEEAVNIIRTRQEEIQRLREENQYSSRKHETEVSQVRQELEKLRAANAAQEGSIVDHEVQRTIHAQEMATLKQETEARKSSLDSLKEEYALATSKVEIFQRELESEASKRSFLEKELAQLRDMTDRLSQEAASHHDKLAKVSRELEETATSLTASRSEVETLTLQLTATKAAQTQSEKEASSARTKARDLDSDLKGLQHELSTMTSQNDKDAQKAKTEISDLQKVLDDMKVERSRVSEEDAKKLSQLQKQLDQSQIMVQECKQSLSTKDKRLADLESQLKVSQQAKALSTSSTTDEVSLARISTLEKEIEKLSTEKTDLQKQLEQAHEDLMLLMEDEETDDT